MVLHFIEFNATDRIHFTYILHFLKSYKEYEIRISVYKAVEIKCVQYGSLFPFGRLKMSNKFFKNVDSYSLIEN